MSRPRKWRRVGALPTRNCFGPINCLGSGAEPVIMSVDEFECIRLIDFEGLNQEECAERMHVARTTVQSMYSAARRKLAQALVNAEALLIEGGNYKLYTENEHSGNGRGRGCGRKHRAQCAGKAFVESEGSNDN